MQPEPPHADDIDRELEKLRGFGSTLFVALATCALLIVAVSAGLFWLVF